jgi:hypothetical protein
MVHRNCIAVKTSVRVSYGDKEVSMVGNCESFNEGLISVFLVLYKISALRITVSLRQTVVSGPSETRRVNKFSVVW